MCALHCGGIYFGRANYEERLQDDSKIVMLGVRVKKSATFDIDIRHNRLRMIIRVIYAHGSALEGSQREYMTVGYQLHTSFLI
jgi:hypothetical protein